MNNEERARGQTASKASEQVATRAQETAERLKSSAHEQIEAAKERAETGREQAAERIRRVSAAMRGMGRDLRDQDDTFVAKYADSLSDGIERVASYVGSLEPASLAGDASRFARNKPAWFFGGAFLVGLAAGRFLKSSQPAGFNDFEREPETDRSRVGQGPSYPRFASSLSEDISTRGVFDSDERVEP